MSSSQQRHQSSDWIEHSGMLQIFRVLGLTVHPAKLALAFLAIVLTFLLGTMLDWVWSVRGGVDEEAIHRFITSVQLKQPYEVKAGNFGIYEVLREHMQDCIFGFMGSTVPAGSVAAGTQVGVYVDAHRQFGPLRNLGSLGLGFWWLCREHFVYFVLFSLGALFIWAVCGGAICRIAAVQFARDEKLTAMQALRYSRDHLFDGFVLAPFIPIAFAAAAALLLVLYGVVLRIPLLGDLIGGVLFVLALVGGFAIALLLVGLFGGGSLLWPAIAAEGQDAYDAFARSISYTFSKPWKTILYVVIATIFASLCWVFVNLFVYFALIITRDVVGFGTSPFGWWTRGTPENPVNKLELIWPLTSPSSLYATPDWSQLSWNECFSALLIGIYVMLVVAMMFSFLASFYYCASTVLYFLLRRDVDRTDMGDVDMEDAVGDFEAVGAKVPPSSHSAGSGGSVSLPVIGNGPQGG